MDRFIKEYHGKKLIDWGAQNSSDFLSFARKFKNYLKRSVSPYGIDVAEFYVGHYYISGFVEKEGKFVYFNYDFPRGQKIDTDVRGCHGGVLIRTAKDVKDYRGRAEQLHQYCPDRRRYQQLAGQRKSADHKL